VVAPCNVATLLKLHFQLSDARAQQDVLTVRQLQYNYDKITCTSTYWAGNSVVDMIYSLVFLCLVQQIDYRIKLSIQNEIKMYGYPKDFFKPQLNKIKVLWRLCEFYLVITCYLLGYTVISFLQSNMLMQLNSSDEPTRICNVITSNVKYDSIFWMLKRIVEFNLWQVPMLVLLWPRKFKVSMDGHPVRFNS